MKKTALIVGFLAATTLLYGQLSGFFMGELGACLGWVAMAANAQKLPHKPQWAWAFLAGLVLILGFFIPIRTLVFVAGFLVVLFSASLAGYRTGFLTFCTGVAMSPVFYVVGQVFTFPIRLQLTRAAGAILQLLGQKISVEGNLITCADGGEFLVEPACAGIALWQTTAILQIFIVGLLIKQQKQPTFGSACVLLLSALFLTIIANLCRMVLLVWLNIPAETLAHDLTGLLCAAAYSLVPFYYLVKILPQKTIHFSSITPKGEHSNRIFFAPAMAATLLFAFSYQFATFRQLLPTQLTTRYRTDVPNLMYRIVKGDVIQYSGEDVLVYLKPIPTWYSSEHHPSMCWQGSGFELTEISEENINNTPIYTGILVGDKGKLRTAWWYDNGQKQTLSQWDWRIDQARGAAAYCIVNVSVSIDADLHAAVKKTMADRLIKL